MYMYIEITKAMMIFKKIIYSNLQCNGVNYLIFNGIKTRRTNEINALYHESLNCDSQTNL